MLHFFFFWKCSMDLTSSSFSLSQQIITQDFARNQVSSQPPQQPSTSTFQSSPSALVSTPVRMKTSNRYSPESQSQSAHHQRPGSRVSPETLVDKSRARYGLPRHTQVPQQWDSRTLPSRWGFISYPGFLYLHSLESVIESFSFVYYSWNVHSLGSWSYMFLLCVHKLIAVLCLWVCRQCCGMDGWVVMLGHCLGLQNHSVFRCLGSWH